VDKDQPSMPERTKDPRGKSQVVKRSVKVSGRQTSVALESAFLVALKGIAAAQGVRVGQLIAAIDSERREHQHNNLSSVIRLFVLEYYCSRMQP
jgi:predicted DNA-binding ribbon-helix-helix protein